MWGQVIAGVIFAARPCMVPCPRSGLTGLFGHKYSNRAMCGPRLQSLCPNQHWSHQEPGAQKQSPN